MYNCLNAPLSPGRHGMAHLTGLAPFGDEPVGGMNMHDPVTWPGPRAGLGRLFRANTAGSETLDNHGFPYESWHLFLRTARVLPSRVANLRRLTGDNSGLGANSSGNRAIPSVFVPTSMGNAYGGRGTY